MTATWSSSPLWFTTRATGVVAFVLLTLATMLGVASTRRALASPAWPKFATQQLHRNISLLSLGFLLVHIVTTLADSYVKVGWTALVIPGLSAYRTLWVALGTIAFDLILVVAVSSMLRLRLSARSWRILHYLSYVAWPIALLHFLKTGTDAADGRWGLWLGLITVALVGAAAAVRATTLRSAT